LVIALTTVLLVLFASASFADHVNKQFGTEGPDVMEGTPHSDWYISFGDNDRLTGYGMNDTLDARWGNDYLHGGPHTDILIAGPGNDRLYGGTGEDELYGQEGDDYIVAGDDKESDEVRGGAGYDICVLSGQDHAAHNVSGCDEIRNKL